MTHRKFIRAATALLMVLALTLPVASPAFASHAGTSPTVPASGGTGGGQTVTINGSNFQTGAGVADISHLCFGTVAEGVTAGSAGVGPSLNDVDGAGAGTAEATACPAGTAGAAIDVVNNGSLTVVTPPHAAGPVNVALRKVSDALQSRWVDVGTSTATDYTYVTPTLTGMSVSSGSTNGGTPFTLTGTNMHSLADLNVFIDPAAPANATGEPSNNNNGTSVTGTTGPHDAGTFVVCYFNGSDTTFSGTASVCGPVTFTYVGPEVNVTATDPTATEAGPTTGTFTFTRTGDTSIALAVAFTVGGSATPTTDYTALVTPVTIGAAASSAIRTVTPVDDAVVEGDETVIVTLAPGSYTIGLNSSATVTIADNDVGPPAETISGTITRPNGHPSDLDADQIDVVLVNTSTGEVRVVRTTGTSDTVRSYSFTGVPAGTYRLSAADNDADYTGCAAGAACGNAIASVLVTVDGISPLTTTQNLTLPGKTAPTAVFLPTGEAGVFGFVVNAFSGLGVGGLTVTALQAGLTPAVTRTAITNPDGSFAITGLTAGGADSATVTITAPAGTQCIVCSDTIDVVAGWNDPAFLVSTLGAGVTGARLEAVIPFIAESPDTSRTGGVDVNTTTIRITNAGSVRTGMRIDFFASDQDGRRSGGSDSETFDLNPGAAAQISGNLLPSGILGTAEIFSVDIGFGRGDLQATVTYEVGSAGNAVAGANALNTEDFVPSAESLSTMVVLPTLFKNYGGGAHKWSSIANLCLTTGVPARQPLVLRFWPLGDTRGGPWFDTRSADPGGCVTFNMRDVGFLPDGTFALAVTSTGTLGPIVGKPFSADFRPGGVYAGSVSYSTTGKVAVAQNAYSTPGGETKTKSDELELFAGLVFKRFNNWNSGIAVVNFTQDGKSGSASITVSIYDEGGRLVGTLTDRVSNERNLVFYMPRLAIEVPDGFRGTAIITAGDVSGNARPFAFVNHVNYERNHAISYNATRQDALVGADAVGAQPCTTLGFATCLWVPELVKQSDGRGNPTGPTTGVRVFNPRGTTADITTSFIDSSGVEFSDARSRLTLPAFGTVTFFMAHNDEIPPFFTGSMRITSTADVVAIANVVDYSVTGRDGSRAFNVPNETGQTQ